MIQWNKNDTFLKSLIIIGPPVSAVKALSASKDNSAEPFSVLSPENGDLPGRDVVLFGLD